MKNLILIGIATTMFIACSNKAKSVNSDSSSDSVSIAESSVQPNTAKTFILTEEGVGSLKMMQPFKDMSKSEEGLYNKVEKDSYVEESSDVTIYDYTLYWDDEKVASFALMDEKGPIVMLNVYSPRVSLENGVKIDTSLRDFVKLKGVKATANEDVMGEAPHGYDAWIAFGKISVHGWWSWGVDILTEQGKAKAATATMDKTVRLLPEDIKPEAKISSFCVYRKDE